MSDFSKGFLITFLGVVIISPDTLLIRLIDADAMTQQFWRGSLSGMTVLLGYWILNGRAFPAHVRAMGIPGIWITLIFSAGTLCFMYSVTHTLVANTLFITSTSPAFAALIALVFLKERVSFRTWMTILATLVGISIIAAGSLSRGSGGLDGDLAALGAAMALASVFSIARAQRAASMVPAFGISGLLSGLVAALLAPDLVIPSEDYHWMAILGLAVVPLGSALLATGPRYLPAPDVGLILLLESIFGPLLVWLVLAEYPGGHTLIGGTIVLGAMAVSNYLAHLNNQRIR